MVASPKMKLSLTLSADLVALVDRDARETGSTRSGVIDAWLRRAASTQAATAVHEATVSYYRRLSKADVDDDEAWANAATKAAARVSYDDVAPTRARRPKRR